MDKNAQIEKRLLTTAETAKYLNVSMAFLERDRWFGALIPFVRIGRSAIRYDMETLNKYIEENVRRSTSDI